MTDVAVFDFDGTLTRRDTLLPFLAHVCGRGQLGAALARHSLAVARAGAARGSDEAAKSAKEALFRQLLRGRALAEVEALIPSFVDGLLARGMRPELLSRLAWHADQGHELVVVSASPELYVGPVARRLGIRTVLATRLEVDAAGTFTGRLLGENVKGEEKVRRLREALGEVEVGWAYGNSRGDLQLLALARQATMVGRWARR